MNAKSITEGRSIHAINRASIRASLKGSAAIGISCLLSFQDNTRARRGTDIDHATLVALSPAALSKIAGWSRRRPNLLGGRMADAERQPFQLVLGLLIWINTPPALLTYNSKYDGGVRNFHSVKSRRIS
jgi:hypothetical protein